MEKTCVFFPWGLCSNRKNKYNITETRGGYYYEIHENARHWKRLCICKLFWGDLLRIRPQWQNLSATVILALVPMVWSWSARLRSQTARWICTIWTALRVPCAGNGIRCVAKYVYDHGIVDKTSLSIATRSGIKYVDLTIRDGKASMVKVNMGSPILTAKEIPVVAETEQVIDAPSPSTEKNITWPQFHGILMPSST